jgi:uncharacterized protein with HEPN domain
MRERVNDRGRLEHILMAINNVEEFLQGYDYERFVKDKILYYAVVKNVEIVGEAAYMLSLDFKAEHTDTPWDQIEKMRHVLVHGYYQILPEVLWLTIHDDLPPLKESVTKYLTEID